MWEVRAGKTYEDPVVRFVKRLRGLLPMYIFHG